MIEIRRYVDNTAKDVFGEWIQSLKDRTAVSRIYTRIDRLAVGNAGDSRSVGKGVQELRIDYGPGYRVYYARAGDALILLLCGGDKSTQSSDIRLAIAYWHDYREREKGEGIHETKRSSE